jgi:hypothetical protein
LEPRKLEQIQARTDRQLVAIINRRLEAGLRLARESAGRDSEIAVERAFAEATQLLPAVRGIGKEQRWRLEAELNRLRNLLDGAADQRAALIRDPRSTAALAHLFWLERGCPVGSPEADWYRAEGLLADQTRGEHAA